MGIFHLNSYLPYFFFHFHFILKELRYYCSSTQKSVLNYIQFQRQIRLVGVYRLSPPLFKTAFGHISVRQHFQVF